NVGASKTSRAVTPCTCVGPTSRFGLTSVSRPPSILRSGSMYTIPTSRTRSPLFGDNPVVSKSNTAYPRLIALPPVNLQLFPIIGECLAHTRPHVGRLPLTPRAPVKLACPHFLKHDVLTAALTG